MKFPILKIPVAPLLAAAAALSLSAPAFAQFGPPPPAGPPRPAKAAAPIDLTGYWVSIVTEDWRFRMITAPKGDTEGVPLNQAGTRIAAAWDPAKDIAAGEQCKSYGAPAIMRVPGRFHITWQDDNTLKIETDAGTQTRLLHFGANLPPAGKPSLQGYSVAQWVMAMGGRAGRGGQGQPGALAQRGGSLTVATTNLRPGYLRKNGAPYSAGAVVTEYYDLTHELNGSTWMIVKTIVTDPTYLYRPFVTSTNLRKQDDATGWSPSACEAK
ncbi:MAG: hypothetical protein LAP40_13050 [Acidobacteriia bacterium]|nr:hypothetical protein [Terriglobia bacterium]